MYIHCAPSQPQAFLSYRWQIVLKQVSQNLSIRFCQSKEREGNKQSQFEAAVAKIK